MTVETIAVVGLGYVGLPLAVAFGEKYETIGFDINEAALASFRKQCDPTGEVDAAGFAAAAKLSFTSDPAQLARADVLVVAVPTPIDNARQPDLRPLQAATTTVGRHMKEGAVVAFESTVYPGTTEEVCVPILERESELSWQEGFFVGYSPERINPGDTEHTLKKIVKVVSGDTPETLAVLEEVYGSIIEAGLCPTANIKEAEAAKVIENVQRDVNIALMNELAQIFDRLDIDTLNVLEAAGSKWNFLPFRPGLVGGHCIGIDPYYLSYKAQTVGFHPEVILSGRKLNDSVGKFIAEKTIKLMLQGGCHNQRVGIMGLTFKEDCPDLRNSKVMDIVKELRAYGATILIHDPRADVAEARDFYGVELCELSEMKDLGALIMAVPHAEYRAMALPEFSGMLAEDGCIVDVKCVLDPEEVDASGVCFWRL
ncbi:MAG: nucleotide sugar dehydrogenase [Thermodesulfobacteriota bacterium]